MLLSLSVYIGYLEVQFRREITPSTSVFLAFDLSGVVIDITRVSIPFPPPVYPFICSSNDERAGRSFLPFCWVDLYAWNGDSLLAWRGRRVEKVPHRQGFCNTYIRPTWPPDVLQWILRLAIMVVELCDRVLVRGLTWWMVVRNVLRFTSCDADAMYRSCKRIEMSSYLRGWSTTTIGPTFSLNFSQIRPFNFRSNAINAIIEL